MCMCVEFVWYDCVFMCVCMCVCVIVIGMHVSCVYVYTQKPHTLSRHYIICVCIGNLGLQS